MKKVTLKILFPFYSASRHSFLRGKVWFRLLIVIFLTGFIFSAPIIWKNAVNYAFDQAYSGCMNTNTWTGVARTQDQLNDSVTCLHVGEAYDTPESRLKGTLTGVIELVLLFYLPQFLFFKVGVDFIFLEARKAHKNVQ